jgi:hypothetical protein
VVAVCILAVALPSCESASAVGDHLDELPGLMAEADTRIGDFDDSEIGFSRVSSVEVDGEGNLYVLEASVPEIRVYDPRGGLVRRIGRRGSGPGEFQIPPRFGVVGDTVWTFDPGLNRITLFRRDGSLVSTGRAEGLAVPLPQSHGFLLPWAMRPDGTFTSYFGRIVYARPDDPPTGVRPTDSIPVPFVRFDATGDVLDTIGWTHRPPPRMWQAPGEEPLPREFVQVGDRRMLVPSSPSTLPWWEPLPDGYLLVEAPLAEAADEGMVRVTRFGLAGDTLYHRELRYRPVPYTDDALDSIAARAARGEEGGMLAVVRAGEPSPVPENWEAIARRLRAAMDFPDFRPPLQSVWVAQDESVWLRRWGENGETARWVVLNPDGSPRGELELPRSVRPLWSRGDTLWAAELDEYDVPWVVRFRIEEGPSS